MYYFDIEDRTIHFIKWVDFIFTENLEYIISDSKDNIYLSLDIFLVLIIKINSSNKEVSQQADSIINKYMNVYETLLDNYLSKSTDILNFTIEILDYIAVFCLFYNQADYKNKYITYFIDNLSYINDIYNLDYIKKNLDNIPELFDILYIYIYKYNTYICCHKLFDFDIELDGYYYILDYLHLQQDLSVFFKDISYQLQLNLLTMLVLGDNMFGTIKHKDQYIPLFHKLVNYISLHYTKVDDSVYISCLLVFKIYNIHSELIENFKTTLIKQQDNHYHLEDRYKHAFYSIDYPIKNEYIFQSFMDKSLRSLILLTYKNHQFENIINTINIEPINIL